MAASTVELRGVLVSLGRLMSVLWIWVSMAVGPAWGTALETSRLQQSVNGAPPLGVHKPDGATAVVLDEPRSQVIVVGVTLGNAVFADSNRQPARDSSCRDRVGDITGNPSPIIECRDRNGEHPSIERNAYVAIYDLTGNLLQIRLLGSIDGFDEALAVAVDPREGTIYVGGRTQSHRFPTSPTTFAETAPGTNQAPSVDAFVARLSPSGRLQSAVLIGGLGYDAIHGLAVDPAGRVFAAGQTDTPGLEGALNGHNGRSDAFVVRLDEALNVQWLRYSGGDQGDWARAVAVDGNRLFIAGSTRSPGLGTTGAAQMSSGGGIDGFIQQLDLNGMSLAFTYLGVVHQERLHALTVDSGGRPVVAGDTTQPRGAFDGGATSGGGLLASSVLGAGPLTFDLTDVLDSGSNSTDSGAGGIGDVGNLPDLSIPSFALPISADAAQPAYGGGSHDGWVAGFTPNLDRLRFLTYLGGSGEDRVTALTAEGNGRIHAVGSTLSSDFPVSTDAAIPNPPGGNGDVFATTLSNDGQTILSSSYLGGSRADRGSAVAVDGQGRLYIAGETFGCDLPLADPALPCRSTEGFVSRLSPDQLVSSDVAITLDSPSHSGGVAIPEEEVEIRLGIENLGPQAAAGVQVELTVPPDLSVVETDLRNISCESSNNVFQCEVPFLAPLTDTAEVLLTTRPAASMVHSITATATSRTTDPAPGNNRAFFNLVTRGRLQLSVFDAELTQGIQDLFIKAPSGPRASQDPSTIFGTREQGSTPMVEGKPTVLRVYLRALRDGVRQSIAGASAELSIVRRGTVVATVSPMAPIGTLPANPTRALITDSINFSIPAEQTAGEGVRFVVNATAPVGVEVLEPPPLDLFVDFWETPPICVVTYRIRGTGGRVATRFLLDDPQGRQIRNQAQALLPTADLHIFPRSHTLEELEACLDIPPLCWGPYELDSELEMASIMATLWTYDQGSNDPSFCDDRLARTHYAGVVRGGDMRLNINGRASNCSFGSDQLVVVMNLGPRAPTSRLPSSVPQAGGTFAHELGHNYCRSHVGPCALAGSTLNGSRDNNYPFNVCSFAPTVNRRSFFGFDVLAGTPVSPPTPPIAAAAVVGDLMGIEADRWTSSYQWGAILNSLLSQYRSFFTLPPDTDQMFLQQAWATTPPPLRIAQVGGVAADPDLSTKPPLLPENLWPPLEKLPISDVGSLPDKVLLVHGVIQGETTVQIRWLDRDFLPDEKLLRLVNATRTGVGMRSDLKSRVRVQVSDSRGRPIDQAELKPVALEDGPDDARVFYGAFPLAESADPALVEVLVDGKVVVESKASSAPQVELLSPEKGSSFKDEIKVVWKSSDRDSETDSLRALLQYSPDGERWQVVGEGLADGALALDASELPGGDQARLRVWVHDGFATGMAESEPFRIASKKPRVHIQRVAPGTDTLLFEKGGDLQLPAGHAVVVEAEVWDPDGDASTDDLRWTLDGKRLKHSGPHLTLASLALGRHVVEVEATDGSGQKGKDELVMRVRAASRLLGFGIERGSGGLGMLNLASGDIESHDTASIVSVADSLGDLLVTGDKDRRLSIWRLDHPARPHRIAAPLLPSQPIGTALVGGVAAVVVEGKPPELLTYDLTHPDRPRALARRHLKVPFVGLARAGESLVIAHGKHLDLVSIRLGRAPKIIERLTGGSSPIALTGDVQSSRVMVAFEDGSLRLLEPGPRSFQGVADGKLGLSGLSALAMDGDRFFAVTDRGLFRLQAREDGWITSRQQDFPAEIRWVTAVDGEIHVLDGSGGHWARTRPADRAKLLNKDTGFAFWIPTE